MEISRPVSEEGLKMIEANRTSKRFDIVAIFARLIAAQFLLGLGETLGIPIRTVFIDGATN